MAHVSRRWLVAAPLGLLLLALAACAGSGSTSGGSGGPATASGTTSQQQIYAARLSRDRQSLDRGVLSYSRLTGLETAATTQFEVTVTDVGRGPQMVQLTAYNGMDIFQQDVPAGGIVGVQIVGCDNLTCASESSPMQPVLAKGQQAQWWWSVAAGSPGPAMITLRADTYDQGTTLSLSEEIVSVSLTVTPTAAYDRQQSHQKMAAAAKSVVGDIETIGSIAAAIGAVGAIVGWIVMMRRKGRAAANPPKAKARKPDKPVGS